MVVGGLEASWVFFFFNDTATTEIYTLSLHDALPISPPGCRSRTWRRPPACCVTSATRSEEHTSELQSRRDLVCRLLLEKKKHHPVEIAAVLKAARESTRGQVIAVMQPHRYPRLPSLFEPFFAFFFNAPATTDTNTLSLHDALPI